MSKIYTVLCMCAISLASLLPGKSTAQCACPNGDPVDSVVHTFNLPQTADFLTTISFPKFNPSTGTLSCVRISGSIITVASLGIRNLDSSDRTYRFRYTQDIILDGPGGLFASSSVNRTYGPALLNKYNTGIDSVLWGPDTTFKNEFITDQTSGSATFLGATGNVNFDFTNTGSTTLLQGSNNYRSTVQTYAVGSFRLAYFWCPNSVLSSGMRNFSVVRDNLNVSLRWVTDNERVSNRYTIEFSKDGQRFQPLTSREAMGIGTASYEHRFTPPAGENGRFYFRVRQNNAQGKVYYTAVKTVSFAENGTIQTSVYPNPAKRQIMVQFESPQTGNLEIELVNTMGQVLESQKQRVNRAANMPVTFSQQYTRGLYWLRVRNPGTGEKSITRLRIE
ncbi:MAG: T9SS type A sorting domain-containing protein [Chitinophagaceae bacterium]|jgi:hypothetical protein|nr:T9SS type A sorting domain-containing protein [Chitinophagaceae bacterium]